MELWVLKVNRHLEEGHGEAREQRSLSCDGAEVAIEQIQLLLAKANEILLHMGAEQELVGREHLSIGHGAPARVRATREETLRAFCTCLCSLAVTSQAAYPTVHTRHGACCQVTCQFGWVAVYSNRRSAAVSRGGKDPRRREASPRANRAIIQLCPRSLQRTPTLSREQSSTLT